MLGLALNMYSFFYVVVTTSILNSYPGNYYTGEGAKPKLKIWVVARIVIDFQPLTLVSSYWLKLSASLSSLEAATEEPCFEMFYLCGINHLQGKLPMKNSLVWYPVNCIYSSNYYLFINVSHLKENIFWLEGISKEYYYYFYLTLIITLSFLTVNISVKCVNTRTFLIRFAAICRQIY